MDSFLTPIFDIWSKSLTNEIAVFGNGITKKVGIDFALKKNISIIAINDIPENLSVLFVVVTRLNIFEQLISINRDKNIILVVPEGFPKANSSVALPIAEFEYLEGIIFRDSSNITFRDDFVLLTILNLVDKLKQLEGPDGVPLKIHLFGFDFQVDDSKENPEGNIFFNSLLRRQQSLFKVLDDQEHFFNSLIIQNHSNIIRGIPTFSKSMIRKSVPKYAKASLKRAIQKNRHLQFEMFEQATKNKVQIVAELTNNHLGDTERLENMVRVCKNQGASVIKIQKRDIGTLYTEEERSSYYLSPFGKTLGEYRKGVELTFEQIEFLTILCADLEIPWFTSVLDLPSLKIIEQFSPVCVKAPSTISNHKNFLRTLANSNIDYVFISTGGTDLEYVNWILKEFRDKKIVLMQCTSSYPTAPQDCNVSVVKLFDELSKSQKIIPGFSSHDIGSLASQLSVALGAKFIEKHVKSGTIDWVHFDGVALDLSQSELERFVVDIRFAERVLGSQMKKILPTEHHKYKPNREHN